MSFVSSADSAGRLGCTGMISPLRRIIGGLSTTMWMSLHPWLTAAFSTCTISMVPPVDRENLQRQGVGFHGPGDAVETRPIRKYAGIAPTPFGLLGIWRFRIADARVRRQPRRAALPGGP